MVTPFQYLQKNIHKIVFNCDHKYIPEYKRAFLAVLKKMDKFFIQNDLYEVVNYQPIVESMLSSHKTFSFMIDEEISEKNWAGVHRRMSLGLREIGMNPKYMGRGITTEGVLCHEFIHYLTLGPEVLTYSKDGDRYETQLPINGFGIHVGGIKRNLTKGTVAGLEAGFALDGGFICEAFTELVKQEIYTEKESLHSYPAQTSLIKLLNNLTGTKVNIQDFLRGDLPNYVKVLGRKNFEKFNNLCEEFQKKYNKNACINYMSDCDYLAAQDLICKTILQNITNEPEKYSPKDYIMIVSTIIMEASAMVYHPNFHQGYESAILKAGDAITNAQPIENEELENEEKAGFNILLKTTLAKVIQQKKGIEAPSSSLDIARETKKLNRKIQENMALLCNFQQCDNIRTILKDNSKNGIYSVKKITAQSGDEYLVANSNRSSWFYKLTPHGYRRIDVNEQKTPPLCTAISLKFTTLNDEKTSPFGYLPSGIETDDSSIYFKLNNGTTFVRYYDEAGAEQIGEQITPFGDSDKTVIVPIDNVTLYSRNNKDIVDLIMPTKTFNSDKLSW